MAEPTEPTPPARGDPALPVRSAARGQLRLGARTGPSDRTTPRTILAALGVHLVVGIVLVRLVSLGHGLHDWFGLIPSSEQREERVTFVPTPKPAPPPVAEKPKAVVKRQNVTAPSPAPSTGPVVGAQPSVPSAPVTAARGDSSGAGAKPRPLGINPNLVGVAPTNADPRVWAPGSAGIAVPRTGQQMLDSVVAYAITQAADSLDSIARIENPSHKPGDWTKRLKNGEKWGWDQTGLRLGKITVPNMLLGLLPMGAQVAMSGNPTAMASSRRLMISRADIDRFSKQAMGEADFKKAVKELRARKDREYQERTKARAADKAAGAVPPKAAGGNN